MADEQNTVFISYRRSVSSFVARAIFLDLRAHDYDVFMDVENIDSGTFDTIILNQIAARAHFLVILTPGSVERFKEPGDWLRREIEMAIDLGRNVVPVLAYDFKFEDHREHLTGKLAQLSRYNALNVPHDYFDAAMERLRTRYLKQPVTGTVQPTPPAEQPAVARKIEQAASQPAPTEEQLTAEQWYERGNARAEDDYAGRIADYTQAILLNHDFAWAYFNRGNARYDQGDLEGAIADYDQAIRLDPQDAKAYNNRGNARADLGDLEGVVADYDAAIRLDPQYVKAYSNRGWARHKQGDLDGAMADYDAAIRLDPQYVNAYNNRGFARYHQGDLEGAMADYDTAIHIDPQYATAYSNRGEAHFAQGQNERALSDFETALQLRPDYKWALAGLAITLHALGRTDEATEHWRKLIVKDTRYRDADWVGKELYWRPELVAEARRLIDRLS